MKFFHRISFFKSKIYLKMFLAFFIAFIFPLSIAGFIAYRISFSSASDKVEEEYAQKLDKICETIDDNFTILRSSAIQLSQMTWVRRIMSMPDNTFDSSVTVNQIRDYMSEITIMCLSNRFVHDIAICFPRQDLIISDRYKDHTEVFFTYLMNSNGISSDGWNKLFSKRNNMTILPLCDVTYSNGTRAALLPIVQTLAPDGGWGSGSIVYFVSRDQLMSYFNEMVAESGGAFQIMDESGASVFASENYSSAAGKRIVLENKIQSMGWKCIYTVPLAVIHERMSDFTSYILSITTIALLAGLIMAYFLARQNYMPLHKLANSLDAESKAQGQAAWKDEYVQVLGSLKRLANDAEMSKSRIQVYFPVVKKKCVETLMSLKPDNEEEILKTLSLIDVKFTHPLFCCFIIATGAWSAVIDQLDNMLSDASVCVVVSQIDIAFVVVLCNFEKSEDCPRTALRTRECLESLQIEYQNIGVGNTYGSPCMLYKSYLEAQRSINNRHLQQKQDKSLLFFSDIYMEEPAVNYGFRDEERLINLLKTGNEKEAISTAFQILDTNLSIYPLTIKYLYGDLIMLPFRIMDNSLLEEHMKETVVMNDYQRIDDMKSQIARLYSYICEKQHSIIQLNETVTMRELVSFVTGNFNDQNLSLGSVSDRFKLSPSQASRLLKKATGVSFSDFVNKMRVEYSKELLHSDTPITSILCRSGFSNDMTFRRVFKKYTGVTPSMYHALRRADTDLI